MGWLTYYREPGQSDLDHMRKELFKNPADLIDGATKRNVFYGAYRLDNGKVGAMIVLLQRFNPNTDRSGHNFGYKEQTETMGPFAADCPQRVLDLLDPVEECYGPIGTGEYDSTRNAADWRAACRANLERAASRPKVRKGQTIKVSEPWSFAGGIKRDTFTLIDGRRNRWRAADGLVVRLPARDSWPDYEILEAT